MRGGSATRSVRGRRAQEGSDDSLKGEEEGSLNLESFRIISLGVRYLDVSESKKYQERRC